MEVIIRLLPCLKSTSTAKLSPVKREPIYVRFYSPIKSQFITAMQQSSIVEAWEPVELVRLKLKGKFPPSSGEKKPVYLSLLINQEPPDA
jgi:hypothetical protein